MGSYGRLVAVLAGSALSLWVLIAAVRTIVVPRGDVVRLTRWVFVGVRSIFKLPLKRAKTYEQRDHALALYAPVALMILPATWVTLVLAGFTAVFWGLGIDPLREAFYLSGSSLFTLGFD